MDNSIVDELVLFKKMYLNKLKHENKSKNTINSYKNTISSFIDYISINNLKVQFNTIKPSTLYSFLDYKEENLQKQTELSSGSKKLYITHLKAFCSFIESESDKLLDFTKLFENINIRTEKANPKGLTEEEQNKLFDVLENEKYIKNNYVSVRNALIFKTILFSGLRVSEMLSLRYSHYIESGNKYEISVIGKGRKQRFVYVEKDLIDDELNELKSYHDINSLVCLSLKKEKIPRENLDKALRSLCRKANIKPFGTHMLRHTFAKQYLKNGGNIVHLQHILGHSNLQTTMIYTNPTQDDIKNGYEEMIAKRRSS